VQYARGTPFIWGTIKGIWLNTPCYKPSTLTSGLVNKTTTVPYKWDLAAYIQSILQEIGPTPPPPQGGGPRAPPPKKGGGGGVEWSTVFRCDYPSSTRTSWSTDLAFLVGGQQPKSELDEDFVVDREEILVENGSVS